MREALAQVKELQVHYGKVQAVNGVSFSLFPGEIFAIIGPNGSGKTSTVECLEGLRLPSGGGVQVFGLDPRQNRRAIYEQMGVQLQEAAYPDKIKVRELCALLSSFYAHPADWRLLLGELGLSDKANRRVGKLSGGEKQRLSILLALLPRPKLLILDELTTGLDPEVRRGMWETLRQIREAGVGILLVSHYMDEVEALADRLLYMSAGRAAFCGTQAAFRAYAKEITSDGVWREGMSLEEIYLLLSPRQGALTLEAIL